MLINLVGEVALSGLSSAAPSVLGRRIYHYTTLSTICQVVLEKKVAQIFFPKFIDFCASCLLHFLLKCGIIIMPKGRGQETLSGQSFLKKSSNLLTNRPFYSIK
jgi:hypothetical protein